MASLSKIGGTRIRQVMGVIIDSSGGSTIGNEVKAATATVDPSPLRAGAIIRERNVAKMAIEPAPRKAGFLPPKDAPAANAGQVGPPDAKITSRKIGLGGFILIGIVVLGLFVALGKRAG